MAAPWPISTSSKPWTAEALSEGRPLVTIILTNDDGVRAPRIRELRQALLAAGLCVVAAPSSNQSDDSRAATYRNPVRAALSEDGTVGVPTVGYVHTAAAGVPEQRSRAAAENTSEGLHRDVAVDAAGGFTERAEP